MCKHRWQVRFADGIRAYCLNCSAAVELTVKETEEQYQMDARVDDVGNGGVTLSDCNFLCDRLYLLMQERSRRRHKKQLVA